MAKVSYEEVTCHYVGNQTAAVDRMSLSVHSGEFMVLVGPSGSGKSTALRLLAGLEAASSGRILIDGEDVTGQPPKDRDIAMVFQNYALYPHMDVTANMAFSLKMAGVPKAERAKRVEEAARILDLKPYLDRKPRQLSGGQRQRVAMGRALVRQPRVFLMDEPLSNLDAQLRVATRAQIAELQARTGVTTVYVTHDQVEAMTMGHRVAVLKDGLIQQCDTPVALYARPANVFVAGFIGSPAMNLLRLPVTTDGAKFGDQLLTLPRATAEAVSAGGLAEATIGLRPETLRIGSDGEPGARGRVSVVEILGADAYVYATTDVAVEGDNPRLVVRVSANDAPARHETITIVADGTEAHAFHPESGERLT